MNACPNTMRIKSAVLRDETILRLGGDVYSTALTWTADNRQILAFIDGAGWPETPADHYYSSRLCAVIGEGRNSIFQDIERYPDISLWDMYKRTTPPYYGFTVLAVDGGLYQYLSTSTMPAFTADVTVEPSFHFNAAKLIYSPDDGRTWHNQDGSTPVARESHQNQTRKSMVFLQEPQDAFSRLSFLQMGKDYQANRDGYVYVYAPNGHTDETMSELVMFRVPKEKILDRGAYEYFAGAKVDGNAHWTKRIDARVVVHTFPRGWVHADYYLSWLPSVAYNVPLGIYMMANASSANPAGVGPGDKPGYLGLWIAEQPWGPWRQILEETAWTPAGDPAARASSPVIAPQWIADDGKSFWLVWNDGQLKSEADDQPSEEFLIKSMRSTCDEVAFQGRRRWRQHHPGWSFNTQRVDLVLR